MLFITEEQANARLNSPKNLTNRNRQLKRRPNGPNNDDDQPVSIRPFNNGHRRNGDKNVPPELRQLAALTALDSTQRDAADLIGVGVSAVSNYVAGKVGDREEPSLK